MRRNWRLALPLLGFCTFLSQAGLGQADLAKQADAEPVAESAVTMNLPHLGVSLTVRKVLDPTSGETEVVAVDAAGRRVDYFSALKAEQKLAQAPTSKITPLLREQLAGSADAFWPVHVWLHFDPRAVDHRAALDQEIRNGAEPRVAKGALRDRVRNGNRMTVEPAVDAVRAMGLPIEYVGEFVPMITVRANAAQVKALSERPFVDRLYASVTFEDTTRDAIETHRWNRVHDFGIRGDGVRVAVLEDNGIDDAPCVAQILNVVGYRNANHNIQDHPTSTATVIGSMSFANPGHARGIEILSANSTNSSGAPSYVDTNVVSAADWAINNSADIVNCSFGFNNTPRNLQMIDRYVDYSVRFTSTTFVISAGNNGSSTGNVSSPGVSFNSITVGAIDDQNDPEWGNDVMATFSSFVDPISTHSDREKPEVAAEGTDITMLDLGCTFTNVASGTSFAAPGIAGMCGALMQMEAGTLTAYPEAMKAVIMAAATHNIEGSSRLSESDGAGGINGFQAYRIVENNRLKTGIFTPSSFTTATGAFTHDIFLQGGDKTRVVLVWDSLANSSYSTDVLSADLDIVVAGTGATAGIFGASSSFDNPYEIVEFCPPVTGWYQIRVNDFRFDAGAEYYGLAWTQDHDGRYVSFEPFYPATITSDAVGPTLGNPGFTLAPRDFANGGRSYLALASVGIGTGFNFSGCRHSFGDVDFLTYALSDPQNPYFSNFTGVYDIIGVAGSMSLGIADVPALEGVTLYLTNLTLASNAPDGVKEIARYEPMTIWSHATELNLGDDGSSGPIPLGFAFPFYGGTQTQCYINANGNITFGAASGAFSETVTGFQSGPPRIAPLWDDLNMNLGGRIRYRTAGASQFIVEWVDVPEFGTTSANKNSVLLILHADGTIDFKYLNCSLGDALVGITPGNGVTLRPIVCKHGYQTFYSGGIYELFTAGGFNLHTNDQRRNKLRFRPRSPSGYFFSFEGP